MENIFQSSATAAARCLQTALVTSLIYQGCFLYFDILSFTFYAQVADEAVASKMFGVSKFAEARAVDLRLQNTLAQAKRILERPPLTEAKKVIIMTEKLGLVRC